MKQRLWSLSQILVATLLMAGLVMQSCSKNVGDPGPSNKIPDETATMKLVPDSMFRVYLKTNICPNAFDQSGYLIDITSPEVANFTGTMNLDTFTCPRPFLQSLKGIQYFSKMKKLILKYSAVDSLNLAATMALDSIKLVVNTDLQYVGLSGCTSMRFFRATDMPVTTLDLSSLPSLNYVNLISLTRLSNLKLNNDGNLRHLMNYGLTSLKTVNLSGNPELYRVYMERCGGLNALDLSKNPKLDQLVCTFCYSLKSVDLSKNEKLRFVDYEWSAVDTVDFSHNPELLSVILMYTPVRNVSTLGNPKLRQLWMDGCVQLQTLDVRQQTDWSYWFIRQTEYLNERYTEDDGYMIHQTGRISPVQTDEYKDRDWPSRNGVDGATANQFGGLRVPQYLDASGLQLKLVKINQAAKDNYSLVMARKTAGLVTPPQIQVYAADKSTVVCNDYDPASFTCK